MRSQTLGPGRLVSQCYAAAMKHPHTHEARKAGTSASVSCSVCMKEVPQSEAKSAEAADYVRYFCGLDCYGRWRQDAPGGARDDLPPEGQGGR